ncbi:MAG: response regulator transcription factor [Sphingobacteriales bacterium]|nr:MAG: response regulator transcription factor [Sphingobacteriales bacterium]
MKRKLKILVVDDHSLILQGYKAILNDQQELEVEVHFGNNCQIAHRLITGRQNDFDICIFDWILPTFNEFENGGDLVLLTKRHLPGAGTIVITSHEEAFVLYNITKKVNPSALLVKSDITPNDLLQAIKTILNGNIFYSETVKQSIKHVNLRKGFLDNYNRQIISLLAKGIKTKNLPQHLPLSISAIDKRKVQIKDCFLIKGGNDEDIIREATKLGLI